MTRQVLVAGGALLGAGLLLCAVGVHASDTPWPEASGSQANTSNSAAATVVTPITLADALQRSLEQNPQLAIYASEVQASIAEVAQTKRYRNPELSLEIENVAGSGDFSGTDAAEITLQLSQQLEWHDKRRQRIASSELRRQGAELDDRIARAALLATTKQRFYDLLAAQQRLALANNQADHADRLLATVEERIAAGKVADIERLRFEPLRLEAQLHREQADLELTGARLALAALWGGQTADLLEADGSLEQLPELPDWADITALSEHSPRLSRQTIETDRAAQEFRRQQVERYPDLALNIGGRRFEETGDQALIAGLSISLPVFDRNRDAIAAARARDAGARSALRAARLQTETDLRQLWQTLQAAHAEATLLETRLLPIAQTRFDAVVYGYRAGKYDALDLLAAEQALYSSRQRHIDTLQTFHRILADLEEMLGRGIDKS
ncbi:MAG: TolC family protein [Desulfuromonadales bacterium]|nr:TolC family protein [Desulfuromonadales bacterium]